MNKILQIAKHEFLKTVTEKRFIIMTLGFPLFMLGIMAISIYFTGVAISGSQTIGYIDHSNLFEFPNNISPNLNIEDIPEIAGANKATPKYTFIKYPDESTAHKDLLNKKISAYIVIHENYIETGTIDSYSMSKGILSTSSFYLEDIFIDNLLRGKIDEQLLQRVKDPINLRQYTLNKEGKIQKKSFADMVIPFAFAFILMITIFTSSGYLLQGIVEEKENRIIEILLSSVTPRELLAGKIIGLGSAGLVQITFWLTAGSMGSIFVLPVFITPSIIAIALIYFALGFLFYASLMAGVGAISNSMREGQQLASIFSITSIIPLVLMNYLIEKPDSTIAIALSIIPFTAPITSMIRVAVTQVPLYQLAISIVILAISTYFVILLSAKVFRMGLLMYGKRPTIREILRYV